MSTPSPRTRIRRLRVEQIFGPGSHDIDISFKLDERVTVLHGRNGSGKTNTLRLLQALQAGQYAELMVMPFKRLVVDLEDGTKLTFKHQPSKSKAAQSELKPLVYQLTVPTDDLNLIPRHSSVIHPNLSAPYSQSLRATAREYGIGWTAAGEIVEWKTGVPLNYDEVHSRVGDVGVNAIYQITPEPSELRTVRERLLPVKFIPADRLIHREADTVDAPATGNKRYAPVLMVDHLAQQIRAVVQEADEQYRLRSTQLDASLPRRLFGVAPVALDVETLHNRRAEIANQEARLLALGLLKEPALELSEVILDDAKRAMFSILLDDRAAKLEPFANIVNKAERLLTSLNQKLSPKQVKLDVTKGYEVLTAGGAPLPLSKLSSGEQHELVLLHELLFSVEPGTLVLLDEPELSLHVTWQETLLEELIDVAALTGAQFVLATHSPYIIGERTDLMVRLGDPA
jgi:ABC-type transport system involved in cytochrome c biogenesis ATPase subunit